MSVEKSKDPSLSFGRVIGKETRLPIGSRAVIRNVWWTSMAYTKKYEGKFNSPELQASADTDQWRTGISGLPESQVGYGHNPEFALKDAIKRNKELIRKLQDACLELDKALFQCLISQEISS
jgi:hypothetical protein